MKIFTTKLTRTISSLLIAVSIMALTSCKKEEVKTPEVAYLRIINASPTLGTFDTYINTQKANIAPFPFGGSTKYVQPSAGACDIKVTIANDPQPLINKSVTLSANAAYSYYLIGKSTNLDGLLITDVMPTTVPQKAYVKFINLSPDASALSLNVLNGASLATNQAYKSSSEFIGVDVKTQTFQIKDSSGNVKTTLVDQPIQGGRYYTIVARGLLNPGNNEQSLSAQAIINQ